MKKFILSVLLVISTLLTFSQDIAFARAHQFTIGKRDYSTNQIVWNGTPTSCDILIKLEDNKVTIYSNQKQEYRVVAKLVETEDGVQYRMLDANGTSCNFYMGPIANSQSVFIAVEYNDFSWMYYCTDESD
jgi:hypothetical protein